MTKSGMVKKNLWVPAEMGQWLRDQAYHQEMNEAAIVRMAIDRLRQHYEKTGKWPTA